MAEKETKYAQVVEDLKELRKDMEYTESRSQSRQVAIFQRKMFDLRKQVDRIIDGLTVTKE